MITSSATLASTGVASCNSYTGCGAGRPVSSARARWRIPLAATTQDSSQLHGENLVVEG